MNENEISKLIVDAAFRVHQDKGPGLLESAYQLMMAFELRAAGMEIVEQLPIPLIYKGHQLGEAFRADIVVNNRVLVELKSTEVNHPVYKKQLLTYLKLSGLRLGLLINFGQPLIKDGITRLVNNL